MEETKTVRTGSQRVKSWRLRNLRKVFRVEILLSAYEDSRLRILCQDSGQDRSAFLRDLIRKAWGESYPDNANN